MSTQIVNNITTKINTHFSQKYPLEFSKIGLKTEDLSMLVEKILSRGGTLISSLSKDEIRSKMENLIQILENKVKQYLELENEKMTQEYHKLQYDKPNNYFDSNKGYETDTTFKYEENYKKSLHSLEENKTENNNDVISNDLSLKDRYYPEEMNYEKQKTKLVKIKINSKDRKLSLCESPAYITFNFSKDAPLYITPINIDREQQVENMEKEVNKEHKNKGENDKHNDIDKDLKNENKQYSGLIDKIKSNKLNQELSVDSKKLIGNSIIPMNLNKVVSIRISSVILFDKYMYSKKPIPYLLLQIPELIKDVTSIENSQILGGDNNILNSIMCLDDYKVMNGYRYYTNSNSESIRFETPRNIDKLSFQLLTPTGEEIKMSSQMVNTPETVVQYSLELEVEV